MDGRGIRMKTEIEYCRHYDPYSGSKLFTCPKFKNDIDDGQRIQFKDKFSSSCIKHSNFTCPYYED